MSDKNKGFEESSMLFPLFPVTSR